jgi:hypothetical protein
MRFVLLDVIFSTLGLCATQEIFPSRQYCYHAAYPIGNKPNNYMMIEMPYLVLA